MKMYFRLGSLLCLVAAPVILAGEGLLTAQTSVDFGKKLQAWDGFGVHYVETHHSRNYQLFPENYGGFNHINAEQREQVIRLVFGPDGLKPGLVKAWAGPFQEPVNDNDDPYTINPAGFDHQTTTRWIRYFGKRGLEETRKRGDDLTFLAGLHAPPGWVTRQKVLQGRDLDPAMKLEVAEYIASWAKYLRDVEGLPVKYISPMNEAENKFKWPEDGGDSVSYYNSEHNLWWPDHQVVDFLRYAREVLDRLGLKDVGLTNGETASWGFFFNFEAKDGAVMEFARRIREDPVALKNLALITSHGFRKSYDPRGVDLLREVRPELHAWTTSYTWGDMSLDFLEDTRNLIYKVKCNGMIPWATVHNDYESDKLSPPATVRVSSNPNSPIKTNNNQVQITKAYYHYKQVSRAGQPKMAVAEVTSDDPEIGLIAFASNGTKNPDAFTLINLAKSPKAVKVRVAGTKSKSFAANVTTDVEYGDRNYEPFKTFVYRNGTLEYTAPARSSVTFSAAR
jgi:hypothetical protein